MAPAHQICYGCSRAAGRSTFARPPLRQGSPMARLDVLKPSEVADPEVRAMLEASGDEMYGVYGHCPELFKAFLEFYRPAKYAGHLPFELKELVRLRVAALNELSLIHISEPTRL